MLKSLPGQLPLVDGGATFSLARSDPFSGSALCLPPITHHFYFFFYFQLILLISLFLNPPPSSSCRKICTFFLFWVSLRPSLFSSVLALFFPLPLSLSLCQCPCGLFLIFLFHLSFIHPFFYLSHCPHLSLIASIRPPSFSLHPPPPPFPKQSVTVMLLKRTQCVILNQTDELGVE